MRSLEDLGMERDEEQQGVKTEKYCAFQSLFTEGAMSENEKTPAFMGFLLRSRIRH
jgi:hypothetical protein